MMKLFCVLFAVNAKARMLQQRFLILWQMLRLRLTAILSEIQKDKEISHITLPSQTYIVSTIINIPHHSGTFLRVDRPTS